MNTNISSNKSILVLGAAGFIGTNLCLKLIAEGNNVVCFDRKEADMNRLASDKSVLKYGNFADFANDEFADDVLRGVDIVYHLISTTCPTNSNVDVAAEFSDNVIPTIKLLDACVRNSVKRIVFLSSGGTVYGKDHTGIVKEEDDANPVSSYGIQKIAIEKVLYLYKEIHNLDYRIVRLANPYGPYQRPNGVQGVVSTFTHKAINDEPIIIYGDGSVVRDYIYIDDAVNGIIKIASDEAKDRLYNLGSGTGLSVNDVCETLEKVTGKKLDITKTPGRKADVPVNILNIERFEKEFGKQNLKPLEEGIKELIKFYEGNR